MKYDTILDGVILFKYDVICLSTKLEFPNPKGYSVRNLKYMRKFAEFIAGEEIVQAVSAQLSWSHNSHLSDKSKSLDEYVWYAQQTTENGWSLSSLEYHTNTKTYQRQAIAENYKASMILRNKVTIVEMFPTGYLSRQFWR